MQLILLKSRRLLLLIMLAAVSGRLLAQTYVGNVEFTSQSALNSWESQWKTVTGNIYITSLASDVVTSLAPLQNITSVGGAIIIAENHSLISLNGLGGLQTAGMLEISFNGALNNLGALSALTTVTGTVNIVGNESLTSLTGLATSLTIGGDLTIRNNPILSTCNAPAICNYQHGHPAGTYLNVSGNAGMCFNEAMLYSACNGPLPVVLTEFDAIGEGSSVRLSWATTGETNASHFDIERSSDGRAWQKAGVLQARGESLQKETYSFSDNYPFTGENLYRLRMADRDATYSYSRIRSVYVREAPVPAYPNPFSESLFLSPNQAGLPGVVELTDIRGKVVYQAQGQLPVSITTSQWRSGTYLLKLTDKEGISRQLRVVKAE
ncbi:T9SS type A sorting domain-containing protein [Dyadobacter fermentans]|uniref:T9SS type A sorting domain-containing protein n=1 Tax=Dyadobacter fermentans TaxID=94254 RepID=UPI001CBF4CB0|nr:T9SS type A sorting domain-containing protein [Dyadobacter fermentans]MBZ1357207.1 T9SS type A sorting domain-containing protein [Dyadobacter fermentans]